MTATCTCRHCHGELEFDLLDAGKEVICPHCQKPTVAHLPPKPQGFPPAAAKSIVEPSVARKFRGSILGVILMFVAGCGLIFGGCLSEAEAKSAMHQSTAAIQYCTGWLMIAAAFILESLRAISKNQ